MAGCGGRAHGEHRLETGKEKSSMGLEHGKKDIKKGSAGWQAGTPEVEAAGCLIRRVREEEDVKMT